jgi:flagellar basal-body rod modification protein FlgD
MAAMAGLLNHARAASQTLAGQGPLGSGPMATASTSATSSTNGSSGNSATITANDFLTLLVTEMQNQDPTADTDPNEYIDQLVQVNSLQQLISINQNLSTALGVPGGGSGSSSIPAQNVPGASAAAGTAPAAGSMTARHVGASNLPAAINKFAQSQSPPQRTAKTTPTSRSPGNLSVPADHPAAHRVAHALDGQTSKPRLPGKPLAQP